MVCSTVQREALFALYLVSIVAALANPANIDFKDAYLMTQGANIITLLIIAYCRRSSNDLALSAGLSTALGMRMLGFWQGGTRWDSLLVTIGLLVNLQRLFALALPSTLHHRLILYTGFSCLVMPVLAALPHLTHLPSIDDETMRNAVGLSEKAYGVAKPSDNALDMIGKSMWTLYNKDTDTKAGLSRVIGKNRSDLYIYFSGSESSTNWKNNFNVLGDRVPTDWCPGTSTALRTHKGFQTSFASVSEQLMQALQAEVHPRSEERIIVVGHSLGGALATLAALYIACKMPEVRSRLVVVTFGAPQVGDGAFVKMFNSLVPTSVRVVNPLDPVPRILDAQLVQVKGYLPVGTFGLESITKSHSLKTYTKAVQMSSMMRTIAAFWPAVLGAAVIVAYITWHLS